MPADRINLLPKSRKPGAEASLQKLLIMAWSIALISLVGLSLVQSRKGAQVAERLSAIKHEAKSIELAIQQTEVEAKSAEQANRNIASTKEVLKTRLVWADTFKELSMLAPATLWLTGFMTKGDKGIEYLEITGQSPAPEAIANYLANLENSFYFRRTILKSSERIPDITPSLYRFIFETRVPQLDERARVLALQAKAEHDKKP